MNDFRRGVCQAAALSALALASLPSHAAPYAGCMQEPTVECMLELSLGAGQENRSHSEIFMRGSAVAAVATKRPKQALDISKHALSRRHGYTLPNPLFAYMTALKAQAEDLAGNRSAAEKTLDEAFVHATTRQRGYEGRNAEALMLIGPTLARFERFEQLRAAYEMALEERAPRAHELLAELGLAYARAGRTADALRIADELRKTPVSVSPQPAPAGSSDEQRANAVRALTGDPFAARTRKEAWLFATAALAEGLAERGDEQGARRVLAEIESELPKESRGSSALDPILGQISAAYARAGDAERAAAHLRGVRWGEAPIWSEAAARLCAAGKARESRNFLARARELAPARDAAALARVAGGNATCGMKDGARELFLRARDAADKTPFCDRDHCANFTGRAQQAVAAAIVKAGLLDLVTDWPPGGLNPHSELDAARTQANQGDTAGGLHRLDAAAARNLPGLERWRVALARAEILQRAGELEQADTAFNEALRGARALDFPNARAAGLVEVAQARVRSGQCKPAQEALREARVSAEATRMSGVPQIHHDRSRAISAVIAHQFARCGYLAEARLTAQALLSDPAASAGRAAAADRLADTILARNAVAHARRAELAEGLRILGELTPSPARLRAAIEIDAQARKGSGSARARAFLFEQLPLADAYFAGAQGDRERRGLIGDFAVVLREAPGAAQVAAELPARLAAESALIGSPNWRARALCELGYTAHALGRGEARQLFDDGLAAVKQSQVRTFPIDPSPAGACAHWLKLARDSTAARSLLDQTLERLRAPRAKPIDTGTYADPGLLIRLAISYAEADNGEIFVDWSRLVWNQ